MGTRRQAPPQRDPAAELNKQVLADREKRIADREARRPAIPDLGLNVEEQHSAADTAVEFLRDEFDRKNFGDPLPTTKRIVYGPDPLLQSCPELRERLQKVGLEDYAAATAEAIRLKGHLAVPDPILQRGLKAAIARFGAEQVATAFHDRIMKIPSRSYEVEVDRDIDEMLGKPLDEAVERYCPVGMAPKFLSERCIQVLGRRGYQFVMDERGDPVKVGTLIMGVIPIAQAERRRQHWANKSEADVREQEEGYLDKQEKMLRDAVGLGVSLEGTRVLGPQDTVTANATETEDYLGTSRGTGVRIERHT